MKQTKKRKAPLRILKLDQLSTVAGGREPVGWTTGHCDQQGAQGTLYYDWD